MKKKSNDRNKKINKKDREGLAQFIRKTHHLFIILKNKTEKKGNKNDIN